MPKKKPLKKQNKKNKSPKQTKQKEQLVTTKLISEEPLDTMVRLPFSQLIGISLEKFLQNLSVLAIGPHDSGNFKIEPMNVVLAGIINEDIVFNINGTLKTYETSVIE